ncbi:hypothetical protein M408DRAFT_145046 [Serendipita vermifera MAFF 305830]|uniref:Uncharacterized protein n=1 Tax=Serendipita vermifera MAFF 305830 TaxID=933852 RepID=A0A0C3AUL0_SERVB|nr:hypothetical protein M408DRAFT_145046 [Serendipita vermifera MAFF 305830]
MSLVNLYEQSAETQIGITRESARKDSIQLSHPPINLFPYEVLSLIFMDCGDGQMERNLNLSLVCTLWRHIVVSNPRLWSNITIKGCETIPELHLSWRLAEISLLRSKHVPLDIRVDLRRIPGYHRYLRQRPKDPLSEGEYNDIAAATLRRLLGDKKEYVHRWRTFYLSCSRIMSRIAVAKVWSALEGQYNALTRLQVAIQQHPSSLHLLPISSPNLGSSTTNQPTGPREISINPSRMTWLSLYSHQIAIAFLHMASTTTFSALSTLQIWIASRQGISVTSLHFPRLSTLRLSSAESGTIIPPLLDAPCLIDVSIVWRSGGSANFLPHSIFVKLKTLRFRLKSNSNSEGAYRRIRESLRTALSSCTSLKRLKIPKAPGLRANLIELVSELRGEGHPLAELKEITLVTTTVIDEKKHETFDVINVAAL